MASIEIIPSSQLDKRLWDECVASHANGLIYARSFYLDAMADTWYGLVIDNYTTIMPLPLKSKWGVRYIYMPPFSQQLGIIGDLAAADNKAIKQKIYSFIKYGSPYMNFSNEVFARQEHCKAYSNYILPLSRHYDEIKKEYKKSIDYSLNKAAKSELKYVYEPDAPTAIDLYASYNKQSMQHITAPDYERLKGLCKQLSQQQQLLSRKIVTATGELLSVAVLINDNKRYYNLINYTTDEGRKKEANYMLYDCLLKELSMQQMLFDFEGSDLPGVKSFYEKFGAVNQPYYHWHFNHLPWILRLIKQ